MAIINRITWPDQVAQLLIGIRMTGESGEDGKKVMRITTVVAVPGGAPNYLTRKN